MNSELPLLMLLLLLALFSSCHITHTSFQQYFHYEIQITFEIL